MDISTIKLQTQGTDATLGYDPPVRTIDPHPVSGKEVANMPDHNGKTILIKISLPLGLVEGARYVAANQDETFSTNAVVNKPVRKFMNGKDKKFGWADIGPNNTITKIRSAAWQDW